MSDDCPETPALMQLADKVRRLQEILLAASRVAVAFSGGVDSSLLLKTALDTLGAGNVLPLFASSLLVTAADRERALTWPERHGYGKGVTVEAVELYPLTWKDFVLNPPERCYLCKFRVYSQFIDVMERGGIKVLMDGTNTDDLKDRRPGLRAIHELGVRTPLVEAGFSKDDVRARSRELGLDSWQQPSSSCLATRLPHGMAVTGERLQEVARHEQALAGLGFAGCRVRLDRQDSGVVYVQVQQADLDRLLDPGMRMAVTRLFGKQGVGRVFLDLAGR